MVLCFMVLSSGQYLIASGILQHTLQQTALSIYEKYIFTFINVDVIFQNIIPDYSSSMS